MSTHAHGPWPDEPAQCLCARTVVATIEETLDCPAPWYFAPGTGWTHAEADADWADEWDGAESSAHVARVEAEAAAEATR